MTPEGKIWIVLKNLSEAITITPTGKPVSVNVEEIEKSVSRTDHEKVFEKMAKDFSLFEILSKPDYKVGFEYVVRIDDVKKFQQALSEAHIKHFGSLEMLVEENFFAVVDVAGDIMNQLQIITGNVLTIPLLQSIVRFKILMPGDGINMRDRYCELRWKALNYLKNNNHIESLEALENYASHRWETEIKLSIDRIVFSKFYEKLMDVYKKRVSPDDKSLTDNIDFTDNASRRAWEKKWTILQVIWTIYEARNKPPELSVSANRLVTDGRTYDDVKGILDGFKRDGCFDWTMEDIDYKIQDINKTYFAETYRKVGLIYDKFAKIYQERRSKVATQQASDIERKKSAIKLSTQPISFNDDEAKIYIGSRAVALPAYKNEHYFCRAMYEHKVNEVIDWSIIYEKINGKQPDKDEWRSIYDTVLAINKRIKETVNTTDALFTWREKTLKRNY